MTYINSTFVPSYVLLNFANLRKTKNFKLDLKWNGYQINQMKLAIHRNFFKAPTATWAVIKLRIKA